MKDTSGPTLPVPLGRFDRETSSWRTCEATSLWDLPMSLATLPEWGTTLGGVLFELPTPEPHTAGRGCSSLPTPTARDHKEQALGWTWERGGTVQTDTLPRAITSLLPTPTRSDANGAGPHGTGGPDLRTAIDLLPTPTVVDMGNNKTPEEWAAWKAAMKTRHQNGNGHGPSLTQEALGVSTSLLSDVGSS